MDIAKLNNDYRLLRERVELEGLARLHPAGYFGGLLLNVVIMMAGLVLAFFVQAIWLKFILLFASAYGAVAISTSGHTASHYAATGNRHYDRLLTLFCFTFLLGFSETFWRNKHIDKHHRHPNNSEKDNDIRLSPILYITEDEMVTKTWLFRIYYKVQILVLLLLVPFGLISPQMEGWVYFAKQYRQGKMDLYMRIDALLLLAHVVVFIVVPIAFLHVENYIFYFLARNLLTGYWGFFVFAPAHYPEEAVLIKDDIYDQIPYAVRQIVTAANFRTGILGRIICQGVEYQIEHHLFPNLYHGNYRKIAPLVKEMCHRNGLCYNDNAWFVGVLKSLRSFAAPKKSARNMEELLSLMHHLQAR